MSNPLMTLYCLNFPNGKKYFGVSLKLKKRLNKHRYLAEKNLRTWPLYQAIRKYGWSSVRIEVIHEGDSVEILKKEQEYIENYHTTDRSFGYNVSVGGTAPMLGRKHSEETKLKFLGRTSPSVWKGKSLSLEHREKMSIARRKNPSPSRGCKWSDESREKIQKVSDSQVEAIRKDPRTQKIIALDYGISQGQVSRIKCGKERNAKS